MPCRDRTRHAVGDDFTNRCKRYQVVCGILRNSSGGLRTRSTIDKPVAKRVAAGKGGCGKRSARSFRRSTILPLGAIFKNGTKRKNVQVNIIWISGALACALTTSSPPESLTRALG